MWFGTLVSLTSSRYDCDRLQIVSTSAHRDVLLSAIGRLLLLALDFVTVYLLTSGLPRHSQHFVKSWKLIYFGNLTEAQVTSMLYKDLY